MALNTQRPFTHAREGANTSYAITNIRSARPAQSKRAIDKAGTGTSAAAVAHNTDAQHAVDNTPIFILPNGRQFQIQVVVRRDGQPEWSFSGLNSLFSTAATAYVDHTLDSTAEEDKQLDALAERETTAPAADTADDDALPWSFNELSAATTSRFPIPAAAVHAAGRTLAQRQLPLQPPASSAAAGTAAERRQHMCADIDIALQPLGDDIGDLRQQQQQLDEEQADGSHMLQQQVPMAYSSSTELLLDMQQRMQLQQQRQQPMVNQVHDTLQQHQQQERQEQQQNDQSQAQQQQYVRSAADKEAYVLAQIAGCKQPWRLVVFLQRHLQRHVLTATAAAAALQQLDNVLSIHFVRQLRQKMSSGSADANMPGQQQTAAAAEEELSGGVCADKLQGYQQSSSSSSSITDAWAGPMFNSLQEEDSDTSDTETDNPAAAGSSVQKQQRQRQRQGDATATAPPNHQLRLLMRVFLRLISVVEANIEQVPAACLVSAAKLSAKLVGAECPVHDWWSRAKGYVVLGEATARWRAGTLDMRSSVDICYSYHHCGYKPGALLQPMLADVVKQPNLLDGLNGTGLCHLTFCATSHMDTVNFKHEKVTAAVSSSFHNPQIMQSLMLVKPYNLVMLLRHLCQLSSVPPQGLVMPDRGSNPIQGLLRDVKLGATSYAQQQQQHQQQQQEEEEEEGLQLKEDEQSQLADQFLAKLQSKQQQQQQQQHGAGQLLLAVIGRMPHMTMQELSTVLHVAVEWNLDCCQQLAAAAAMLVAAACLPMHQQQQQQWVGVPPLLLDACEQMQQELLSVLEQPEGLSAAAVRGIQQQLHQVTGYTAAWSEALTAAAASSSRPPQQLEGRKKQRPPIQLPRTAADPVIFLHRLCQCGYAPPRQLTDRLLQQLGPNLHKISLLQANLLCRTLVYRWEDGEACGRLLAAGLGHWMTNARTAASGSSGSSTVATTAAAVNPRVFQLPFWQLKALIVAAGRFGVLAADVAGSGSSHQQQQRQQRSQYDGREIASAFLQGILQHLSRGSNSSSSSHGTPTGISAWRADMVLALFWAAARLRISPPPAILSAGTTALTARMRRHIAANELPHLVWAAAELKLADKVFLDVLCATVAKNAHRLHPKSLAAAAWSLVQLRCPHTVVLEALSKALLRPDDISSSREILRSKIWHRQQQQQQQQRLYKQSPTNQDLHDWQSSHTPISRSSVAGQSLNNPSFELLVRHPRVALLGPEQVAKLAAACVMAGWAPPLLLLLLAVQAEVMMDQMPPALLAQLMWSYASANCPVSSLLHAAAARAAQLAAAAAFTNSKQPLALLGAFRALGLSSSEADVLLRKEVVRLKTLERGGVVHHQQQQHPQQQQEGMHLAPATFVGQQLYQTAKGMKQAAAEASSVLQHGSAVLDELMQATAAC